ncbi:TonB-dependent receptor [Sphingomonas sp. VDB2]|uniref:TonB-dependent receptor n=1 Tax=Sphingomonas sp. VDB2 TaxID=3228751 RepID=UPI003A8077E6
MSYRAKLKLGLLSATIISGAVAAMPAMAQTAAAAAEAEGDMIVVTGTRRSTTLMETPINISAIGAAELASERLDDVRDLGAFTPGITVTDTGPRGAATIVMRGLSADDSGASGANYDNAIGTYLGEIPLYLDFKFIDIERVETLLGPQGTLYGLGTLAGAIRYIPNRPDPTRFSGEVHGRAYDVAHSKGVGYVGDATLNIPIIKDVLAFRTATGYYYDPGFIDYPFLVAQPGVSIAQPGGVDNPLGTQAQQDANFAGRKDLNFEKTFTTRNQLGISVPDFNAYLTYAYQKTRTDGRQATTAGVVGEGKYEAAGRYAEPSTRRSQLISLEMEAQLGDVAQAVWASAFTKTKNNTVGDVTDLLLDLDYDYELFPAFAGYTTGINTRKQFNQEIRLVSTHGGPFSWVVGGFYNSMKFRSDSVERLPGFAEFAASPTGSAIYGGFYDGLVRPDGAEYVSFTRSKTEEQAVFGELSFKPIPQWQITAGGRYFRYDTSITGGSDTPMTRSGRRRMPYPSLTIDPSRVRSGQAGDDGFVWKFNTSFNFTPDLMAYATYSKGYRIGGVNRVVPCIQPLPVGQNLCALPNELTFGPDKVKNLELGMRAQLFDRRLSTSISVFQIKWDGIQLASQTVNGAIGITANGGKAKSQGVDFTFNARITDQFTVRGNYSYLDAKLTEDVPGLLSTATGSADLFSGDRLPGSAKNSGAASAVYTMPMGDNDLRLSWTATYTGGILTRPGARGGGERLPSYVMHRASATYSTDVWEISLFANNIFDKYALTGVSNDLTRYGQVNDGIIYRGYAQSVAQPRTMGVEGRVKF